MASSKAMMRAAQAWCTDKTRYTEMDPVLAEAFADILDEEWMEAKSHSKELEDMIPGPRVIDRGEDR